MNPHRASRYLVIAALLLLLGGFLVSAVYWTSDEAAFLAIQEGYGEALSAAASPDADTALAHADAQWDQVSRSARRVEAHAHLLFLCIMFILFALVLMDPAVAGSRGALMLGLAVGGLLVYPAGLLVQATGAVTAGQVLAGAGALLILAFSTSIVIGLYRRVTAVPDTES